MLLRRNEYTKHIWIRVLGVISQPDAACQTAYAHRQADMRAVTTAVSVANTTTDPCGTAVCAR
jgi:hypothetical protein